MTQLLRQRIPFQAVVPARQEVIVFPKDHNNRPVVRTSNGRFIDTTGSTTDGIQEALDNLETDGGVLRIMAGDYSINATRLIYSSLKPISIIGSGWETRLTWTPATDTPATDKGMLNISGTGDADANHCTQVIVRDLYIDFGSSRAAGHLENRRGINIYNADNVYVSGCYLKGCRGETIGLGNFGSATTPGNRAWVTGNVFVDFAQDGINPNVFWVVCANNTFYQGDTGIEAGRDYITIENNDFNDLEASGIKLSSLLDFVITGNRFRDVANDSGVANIEASIHIVGGGSTDPTKHAVIADNVIFNPDVHTLQTGINVQKGSPASQPSYIEIVNNVIVGPKQGIVINQLNDGYIHDNLIIPTDTGTAATSSSTGISLLNTVDVNRNLVCHNYVGGNWTNKAFEDQTTGQGNILTDNWDKDGRAYSLYSVAAGSNHTYSRYSVAGSIDWAVGIINTVNDNFAISRSTQPGTNDAIVIDTSSNTKIVQKLGIGSPTFTGDFELIKSVSGGVVAQITNSDNTNGTAVARLRVESGGASGGDADIVLGPTGLTPWTVGMDNSDSDKFKIANTTGLGTSDRVILDGSNFITVDPVAPQNTAAKIYSGSGTPEAAVTAAIGSIFLRTDGGVGTSIYVKESGAGNTGWIAK